ncbi:MAG: hypothetical protein SFU27_06855 [Thermonemataceae bacterium]|nr:hypothetical protein [Thermonemataceae bacterium]
MSLKVIGRPIINAVGFVHERKKENQNLFRRIISAILNCFCCSFFKKNTSNHSQSFSKKTSKGHRIKHSNSTKKSQSISLVRSIEVVLTCQKVGELENLLVHWKAQFPQKSLPNNLIVHFHNLLRDEEIAAAKIIVKNRLLPLEQVFRIILSSIPGSHSKSLRNAQLSILNCLFQYYTPGQSELNQLFRYILMKKRFDLLDNFYMNFPNFKMDLINKTMSSLTLAHAAGFLQHAILNAKVDQVQLLLERIYQNDVSAIKFVKRLPLSQATESFQAEPCLIRKQVVSLLVQAKAKSEDASLPATANKD